MCADLTMKRILFFDIDATLTKTVVEDKKYDPLVVALSEIYEKPISKEGVKMSGGTIQGIIANILKVNDISLGIIHWDQTHY